VTQRVDRRLHRSARRHSRHDDVATPAKAADDPIPSWGRQGVLFGLATTFDAPNPDWVAGRPEQDELRLKLALVKTTFARFDRTLCRQLVYRGWWLTGCCIATHRPDMITGELPQWRPLAGEAARASDTPHGG
jgi:hypothetical protein